MLNYPWCIVIFEVSSQQMITNIQYVLIQIEPKIFIQYYCRKTQLDMLYQCVV